MRGTLAAGAAAAMAAAWLALAGGAQAAAQAQMKRPQIVTSDVARFFKVYDAAHGHPTAEALARDYLAPGSAGLHDFAKLRRVTPERIAANIAAHPEVYEKARTCLAVLPTVRRRLTAAFARLAALDPQAKSAPVTFVIGRGRPVGITDPAGVTIGVEALCSADFMDPNLEDRFVHNIAHEWGHIQQPADVQALNPGDPGATVLRLSLIEGAGEFTAELISGGVGNYQHAAQTRGREAEIERAFVADEDKTDVSRWLYNYPGTQAWPSDLGYWVGYRIVKAYYDRHPDKAAALEAIYGMRHPHAFVAASGWKPAG